MKIIKTKDPWWITFKIVVVLLLAISVWSAIFPPLPNPSALTQGK